MDRKIALITGGSSGIGRAIAIELARNGIEVIINFSTSKSKAEEARKEIALLGGKAHIFQADITVQKEVSKLFEYINSNFQALDILINNAGMYIPDFIETHNVDNWDKIFNLNLRSKFLCTQYSIPLLKKSSSPKIINIATRGAEKAIEESSAYCCAAAGIAMLTEISALELSKYNIKVNTVSPGLTRTPMTEKTDTEQDFAEYALKNPSKRIGLPQDIANVISFLISDKAEFINGENINVSGGIIMK
jgi:3-oxoacyl-[acyl-carrier protein] reductase